MTDCINTEMRDLLPDFVNGLLSEAETESVTLHVASCQPCADEVTLLRSVLALSPQPAAINVASIVAAIAKSNQPALSISRGVSFQNASDVRVANESVRDESVRSISSAPSVVRKVSRFSTWQIAASMTLIAAGGLSVAMASRGVGGFGGSQSDTTEIGQSALVAQVAAGGRPSAMSLGELSEFTDDEIEAVIKDLDKWDGAAAADPLPVVPILSASSGTSR